METFKQEIKKLAEEQRNLKNLRKSVNYQGVRTMEPWQAQMKHYFNGKQLRIMYAAYGIIRGKSYSQIENYYSEEMHPLKQFDNQIQKLVEKYAKEVVCSDK